MKSRTLIALGAVSASTIVAYAGVGHSWNLPINGDWNVGANWGLGVVPGTFDGATLGHVDPYVVNFSGSDSVGVLSITNANAQLNLINIATLTTNGNMLLNNGLIVVNSNLGGNSTSLLFAQSCSLDGTGTILLNVPGAAARLRADTGMIVTQSASHTIEGRGQIEATFVNNGIVRSNVTGNEMRLITNPMTNNHRMEAVNGARLDVSGITVTQGVSGVVHAQDAGSIVELASATIVGGALTSSAGGQVSVASNSSLESVFASAEINLINTTQVSVDSSFTNDGLITVNSNFGGNSTTLMFNDTMTLAGSGTVVLNVPGAAARLRTGVGATVTVPSAQTIEGRGQIEGAIINQGLISSNIIGGEMRLLTNDKTNHATMEAINGARLDLSGITVNQFAPGMIVADGAGSRIELGTSTVVGGDLISTNGGDVVLTASSVLDGVSFVGDLDIPNTLALTIFDSFTNDGVIEVNSNFGGNATTLLFNDTMTLEGAGTVKLNSFGAASRIQTGAGVTLTVPSTQTIEGRGQIEGAMINHGLISSNILGGELRLLTNDKTNHATMEAINGARLDLSGITVMQFAPGMIVADGAGSRIELGSSTVVGGDLISTNGGDVVVTASSVLDGVEFVGDLDLPNTLSLSIASSFMNDGLIEVNSNFGGNATTLLFTDTMTLEGTGTVRLNSAGAASRIQTSPDVTMTIGSGQSVEGRGQIEGAVINDGLVRSDIAGQEMRLLTNDKLNQSTIEAVNGARVDVSGITLTQGSGGVLAADGAGSRIELGSCEIVGGVLNAMNSADVLVTATSTLTDVDFSGRLDISNTLALNVRAGTQNNGLIVVNSNFGGNATSLVFAEEMTLGGNGTIRLQSPGAASRIVGLGGVQGTIGSGQRVEGVGQIAMDLILAGTIAPGLSVGTMSASAPIMFGSSAHFEAEINASGGDLLDSTSSIELHGTLDVLFIDGFAPTGYWARTILEGSDITGKFDVVNMPAASEGFVTRVFHSGTEVVVGQSCLTDLNLDGVLNFFDVSAFLNAFGAMDPAVDLNGDGFLNFFDVSAFLNGFGGGCS